MSTNRIQKIQPRSLPANARTLTLKREHSMARAPIIAKDEGGRKFAPHPAGAYRFVCGDVHDEGMKETFYGKKHQIRVVFVSELVNEEDEEKRPYEFSAWFTLSLSEKANLRKFLESWRGRAFTDEELAGFDVTNLIGANAYVQIAQKPKKDGSGQKSVIQAIMKLPRTMNALEVPKDFVPVTERKKDSEAGQDAPPPDDGYQGPGDDDDLPF